MRGADRSRPNPSRPTPHSQRGATPESRAQSLVTGRLRSTARGHDAAGRNRYAAAVRDIPEGQNPGRGSGRKQARQRQVAEETVEDVETSRTERDRWSGIPAEWWTRC